MSFFHLSDDESLFYLYTQPREDKPTLVFINALIGQTDMWEGYIGKTLGPMVSVHCHTILGGKWKLDSIH